MNAAYTRYLVFTFQLHQPSECRRSFIFGKVLSILMNKVTRYQDHVKNTLTLIWPTHKSNRRKCFTKQVLIIKL